MEKSKVAFLIIGNEVLNGKVSDGNLKALADELWKYGVKIKKCVIVEDVIEIISNELRLLYKKFDLIFTSGGIGPTHDDVTIEAVAHSLNKEIIDYPELIEIVHKYFGNLINNATLRMAKQPKDAEFLFDNVSRFPTVKVDKVVMLPGIPTLLKAKLPYLLPQLFPDKNKLFKISIMLINTTEWEIEEKLTKIAKNYSDVLIGSYPQPWRKDFTLEITFESSKQDEMKKSFNEFKQIIKKESIVEIKETL